MTITPIQTIYSNFLNSKWFKHHVIVVCLDKAWAYPHDTTGKWYGSDMKTVSQDTIMRVEKKYNVAWRRRC